tara:strand:- start:64 stop:345 length:282 start_codon:yes stop_codon:yes gene_type:complete
MIYSYTIKRDLDYINYITPSVKVFTPPTECDDSTPIENLGISTRLKNVLTSVKVFTLGDLRNVDKEDLISQMYKQRNFGRRSLTEINEYINTI